MPQFPSGISERTPQDDDYILIGKNGQAPGKAKVSAIAAKATEDLAAVAKSGSYDDLTDKPTIPAAVTVDRSLSTTSVNPVQNKVITAALNKALTYEISDNLTSLDEVQQCTKPGAYQVSITPGGDPDPLLGDSFGILVLPVNEGGDYIIQIGYTYDKMAIRGTQAGPGEYGDWTDLTAGESVQSVKIGDFNTFDPATLGLADGGLCSFISDPSKGANMPDGYYFLTGIIVKYTQSTYMMLALTASLEGVPAVFSRYYSLQWGEWKEMGAGGSTVEIIDNLNSTSKTAALSANMGHLLGLQKMAYVNGQSRELGSGESLINAFQIGKGGYYLFGCELMGDKTGIPDVLKIDIAHAYFGLLTLPSDGYADPQSYSALMFLSGKNTTDGKDHLYYVQCPDGTVSSIVTTEIGTAAPAIEIVNDLNDSSTDKALSAAMGKQLNSKVTPILIEDFDVFDPRALDMSIGEILPIYCEEHTIPGAPSGELPNAGRVQFVNEELEQYHIYWFGLDNDNNDEYTIYMRVGRPKQGGFSWSLWNKFPSETLLVNNYQPLLKSGTNIKTINNQSILGAGNIEVGGSDITLTGDPDEQTTDKAWTAALSMRFGMGQYPAYVRLSTMPGSLPLYIGLQTVLDFSQIGYLNTELALPPFEGTVANRRSIISSMDAYIMLPVEMLFMVNGGGSFALQFPTHIEIPVDGSNTAFEINTAESYGFLVAPNDAGGALNDITITNDVIQDGHMIQCQRAFKPSLVRMSFRLGINFTDREYFIIPDNLIGL